MKVTVAVDGVGDVVFERSLRARRVNVSVRADGRVRVAVPKRVSFETARRFFDSKIDWIIKHLERAKKRRPAKSLTPVGAVDKEHAKKVLVPRLAELAEQFGFEYAKVSLRRQKTRWGSCSPKNNISLNIALAGLEQELIDYVLLHELTHTRVKDHSKKFWHELDKCIPNSKKLNKQLKNYCLS